MKNYLVTVNGTTYDVMVEETSGGNSPTTIKEQPVITETKQAEKVKEPVKSEPAKTLAPSGKAGAVSVNAPMPGTILDVKANIGENVSQNQVVLVLEAMKMENEIVTPSAGKIASINVKKGDSVNSGDVLFTLE